MSDKNVGVGRVQPPGKIFKEKTHIRDQRNNFELPPLDFFGNQFFFAIYPLVSLLKFYQNLIFMISIKKTIS